MEQRCGNAGRQIDTRTHPHAHALPQTDRQTRAAAIGHLIGLDCFSPILAPPTEKLFPRTIFRLGEQKLAKNNQDDQIQNISLCNMYFSKKVYAMKNGGLQKLHGEFSRFFFVLKVTLQSVSVTVYS